MMIAPAAMADNLTDNNQTLVAADEGHPVRAAITKVFQMPVGTDMPDAVFQFEIDPVSVDDIGYFNDNMPSIPTVDINTIDSGTHQTSMTLLPSTDDTLTYYAESGDIFADVVFPHAGLYVYTVVEVQPNNGLIDDNWPHETLTYSQLGYKLSIYVANRTDGTGTYIYELGTEQRYLENDQWILTKVDPTPGGYDADHPYSQMAFTNTYVKTNGTDTPDNPDPTTEATLSVSNHVEGILANPADMFTYTISLTPPSLVTQPPTYYKAYIVENAAVIDPAPNAAGTTVGDDTLVNGHGYLEISTKVPTTFLLKGGQSLVFVDTPVGTNYVVAEENPTGYEPHLIVTTNGDPAHEVSEDVGVTLSSGKQWVGEGANIAAFTNIRTVATPTGLTMASLPFVGVMALAGLAIIGFAWFTIRGKRRRVTA